MARLYEKWRENTYSKQGTLDRHIKNEFGTDDYI
jgi:hypothetical protein